MTLRNLRRLRLFIFCCARVAASSIIPGPSAVFLQSDHLVLYNSEIVQGFVRLNSGFTIPDSGTVTLDTFITVSGGIDLRDTGQLQLLSDLLLDSSVTLSSGGQIKGRGHSIILNGNITIPANKTLQITGDTLIEGNGNTLLIDANAQLFVDTGITLTLKNLVLKNTRNSLATPPIGLAASGSKLALDNVVLAPTGDFLFPQGQLFIHHDVLFTGTSAFIYQSTQSSHITSHACLGFDLGTTFSFAPATTSKDLIVLDDQTSILYLNGCTLVATSTGLRLTKGRLLIDNHVTIENREATQLSNGICFGNSALGSTYDLDVSILGGAQAEINGKVNHDPA